MHLTRLAPHNLPDILTLWHATGGDASLDVDGLYQRTIGDPTCESDLLLLAQSGDSIVGLAFGCVRSEKGVIKAFAVHPDWQRQGVATLLVETLESAFAARGLLQVYVGAVPPNYFSPGVSLTRTPAIALLMHRGYTTDRSVRVDMQVDLAHGDLGHAEVQRGLESQGIRVSRGSRQDVVHMAEFATVHFSEAWREEVLASGNSTPPRLYVARRKQKPVGFAAYGVVGHAHFGPIGTHPDYRGRGIGTVLLKKCLIALRDEGYGLAKIGWAGPVDYYARTVGATIADAYWCFEKPLTAR